MTSQPPNYLPWSSRRRQRKDRLRRIRRSIANNIAQSQVPVDLTHFLDGQQETSDNGIVNSTSQLPYVIRVRVSRDRKTISPAVPAQVTASADIGTTAVRFGGPMATLRSEISMVPSRDLLYFDQELPLIELITTLALLDPSLSETMSPITRVALHLTRIPKKILRPLWMSVDCLSLSHLFLVCDSDNLRPLVENVPSDEWGFRPILETEAEAREPRIRELILSAFGTFAVGNVGLEYSLVFDWEGRGRDRG